MKTATDILREYGLSAPPPGKDRHYTTCPKCSAGRSRAHQKTPCLSIKIDAKGATWCCHHCGWSGPEKGIGKSNGHAERFEATYNYPNANGVLQFQKVRNPPGSTPRFFMRRPDHHGGWINNTKGVNSNLLYRLPEVIEAIAAGHEIACVEGERDADNLWAIGIPATCNAQGASEPDKKPKWKPEHSEQLRGADIVVMGDHDPPGYAHVDATCRMSIGVAKRVRRLVLAAHWPECPKGGDISDWLAAGHTRKKLDQLLNEARDVATNTDDRPSAPTPDDHAVIQQLAALLPLDYQRRRLNSARNLGITVGALDKMVRGTRAQAEEAEAALPHWKVEPWNAEVSGATLLADIEKVFRRYIVLPEGAGVALALWTLHAWTMDAGDISPFLVLVSPTKRCGKTNTLIVLFYITPRSELASNISASALFRYVEQVRPTLLIDEADSFLKDNEEMRGILDSGHTKTAAHVIRNVEVNGEHKPRRFSTWAPKAIATIRGLADTLEDRSVVVMLQRKPPGAKVERLRKRDSSEFETLRRQAFRWAEDNLSALADPDPQIPDALNDRAADNWRPLLAIADLAGGDWPNRARDAACLLSGEGHDAASINVELLADIRPAFGDADAIRSADLLTKLTADPERPWVEWKRGKPLTQKQLGGLLKPFGIKSETVHLAGFTDAKGYKRVRFEGAWEGYLPRQNPAQEHLPSSPPISETSKRRNADGSRTTREKSSVLESSQDGSKMDELSYSHTDKDTRTDGNRGEGVASHSDHENGHALCAQCRGDEGAPPTLHRGSGYPPDGIWLHSQCSPFWLREHPTASAAPRAKVEPDPWADYPDLPPTSIVAPTNR